MLVNSFIVNKSLNEALIDISQGAYYLFIYLSVSMLASTVMTINSSENYKGAWIYRTLPIELPGVMLTGALKGFILKYLIPVYLFVSLIFAIPYGIRLIPHLILIFLNMMILIILIFKWSENGLPFNKDFQHKEDNRVLFSCWFFCILCYIGGTALRFERCTCRIVDIYYCSAYCVRCPMEKN